MTYTVSITRQGQISIPAKIRRLYGFPKPGKVLLYPLERQKIVIEPMVDFFSLRGSIKAKGKVNFKKIREDFKDHLAFRKQPSTKSQKGHYEDLYR